MRDTSCETGGIKKVLNSPISLIHTGLDVIVASDLSYPNLTVVVGQKFEAEIKLIGDKTEVLVEVQPGRVSAGPFTGGLEKFKKITKVARHPVTVFYATDRKYRPHLDPISSKIW